LDCNTEKHIRSRHHEAPHNWLTALRPQLMTCTNTVTDQCI
jgi:hypothetical protein